MSGKLSLSHFIREIQDTGVFMRPSRKLAGKWMLYQYYTEHGDELVNIREDQLKKDNRFWDIEFSEEGFFRQSSNLHIRFMEDTGSFLWKLSRNFLRLLNTDHPYQTEEFQYSVEKDHLKLLKKNKTGRIEFFGFFKKQYL